jgi:uncharacterized protein YkwD
VRAGGPTRGATLAALLALMTTRASAGPTIAWSSSSASPVPIDPTALSSTEREALAHCGTGEAGLLAAVRAIVDRKVRGLPVPELDEIALLQRASGEPHPWARAWVASASMLGGRATMANLDGWLGATHGRERRCAVATATSTDGTQTLAVVAVDVLADLAPLPTHARPGQWLSVEATLRVPALGGDVLVLGPSGVPRSIPTAFDGKVLRARFAPERPGEFTVQVVADVASGRRPVLEATVLAGVDAPTPSARIAPGEDLAPGAARSSVSERADPNLTGPARSSDSERADPKPVATAPDDDQLAEMVASARGSLGLARLTRHPSLDAIARDHAQRMARTHELAHQLDDGDPLERLHAAGIDTRYVGENLAHAPTVRLAHRALWVSPSHRANLVSREFERIGVGVVRDEHGDAWAVEIFASAF